MFTAIINLFFCIFISIEMYLAKQNNILNNKNVLVVEDDEINSQLIKEVLTTNKFNVTLAKNGQEAVKMVENNMNKFLLIIMDIKMPIMNGHEACLLIKQLEDIPVIAHTADIYFKNSEKYKTHNFDQIVFKPFPIRNLLKIVHSYTEKNKDSFNHNKIQLN